MVLSFSFLRRKHVFHFGLINFISLYIFDIHIEFDARRKMTAISHYKKALISFKISCISFESLRILYRFRSKWLNFCCELNCFFFLLNTKDLHNCCALGRTWCGVSPTCTTGTCQTRGWRCSPSSGFSSWWCSCAPGPWGARCVRTACSQVGGSAGSCPRARRSCLWPCSRRTRWYFNFAGYYW